jgi:hypothetical protein
MKKIQKFIVREKGIDEPFFVILGDYKKREAPLFCEICRFVMNKSEDSESHSSFGCCHECSLKFAQSRSEDWKKGWRPKKKDIDDHKKEIESKRQVLFFSHDN